MTHYLLWLTKRYMLAWNLNTTLMGERSSHKIFSHKKSFSIYFYLKIFNKQPFNIKKKKKPHLLINKTQKTAQNH